MLLVERVGRGLQALLAGARAVTAAAAADFAAGTLQPASFHIARWLDAHGPAHSNDIALGVGMDKSAASACSRSWRPNNWSNAARTTLTSARNSCR